MAMSIMDRFMEKREGNKRKAQMDMPPMGDELPPSTPPMDVGTDVMVDVEESPEVGKDDKVSKKEVEILLKLEGIDTEEAETLVRNFLSEMLDVNVIEATVDGKSVEVLDVSEEEDSELHEELETPKEEEKEEAEEKDEKKDKDEDKKE